MWIALVLTAAAAVYDMKTGKVPNRLTFGGMAAGVLLALIGGPRVAGDAVWGAFIPILILWVPFRLHMIGAGDVKLLAMCGAFGGSKASWQILLFSFAAGAVWAALRMVKNRSAGGRARYFVRYMVNGIRTGRWPAYMQAEDKAFGIHFALPILLGQLAACLLLLIRR